MYHITDRELIAREERGLGCTFVQSRTKKEIFVDNIRLFVGSDLFIIYKLFPSDQNSLRGRSCLKSWSCGNCINRSIKKQHPQQDTSYKSSWGLKVGDPRLSRGMVFIERSGAVYRGPPVLKGTTS